MHRYCLPILLFRTHIKHMLLLFEQICLSDDLNMLLMGKNEINLIHYYIGKNDFMTMSTLKLASSPTSIFSTIRLRFPSTFSEGHDS